ncbi:MAG: GNAT family N-acetyltransferase [Dysgonomonas sp.]
MKDIKIRKLKEEDEIPYDLLYLADPSKEAVGDYLERGFCYVAEIGNIVIGVYVLLPTRPFTAELVNLAVDEDYQNKGLGKMLVNHAIDTAKNLNYKVLEVGTGNAGIGQLALYQKCGFTIVSVDFDFFKRHYSEPIFENGIECEHMIRMRMDL